jgi:prepilin-type N-terminal cleavage/methylation domain-containing protein
MKKAFTLVELLIVMAVIAILVGIAIPSFRAMQQEATKTKALGDTRVLKLALESYYKNNGSYPVVATYQTLLLAESPPLIEGNLYDPFGATATTQYVYKLSTSLKYYVVYSVGASATAGVMTISDTGSAETTAGKPIYSTNGR